MPTTSAVKLTSKRRKIVTKNPLFFSSYSLFCSLRRAPKERAKYMPGQYSPTTQNDPLPNVDHWHAVPVVNIGQKIHRSTPQLQLNYEKLTFPYTSPKPLFGKHPKITRSPLKSVKFFPIGSLNR
jgi:hypothetical protein